MIGGRVARRDGSRAARMRIAPGSSPERSSGTTTLRQRAGRGAGQPVAAVAGAGVASAVAATRRMGASARSASWCSTYGPGVSQISTAFLALLATATQGAVGPDSSERLAAAAPPALTVRQLVGRHMVFAYDGLVPPQALRRRIARGEAAGVILFARNVRSAGQVRDVMRGLQAIPRPAGLRAPLIVMVDQEGGPVRRIPGAPARAADGRRAPPSEARADGRDRGDAARRRGEHGPRPGRRRRPAR